MASVTLAFLQPSVPGIAPAGDTIPGAQELQRVQNFEAALARHGVAEQTPALQPTLVAQAAQVTPTGVASDASGVSSASDSAAAEERARQGLGLDGPPGPEAARAPTDGDMILDGIERLRGVFDAREARVTDMMQARSVDAQTLLAMQVEVAEFTMLVDITSKLTGKSTQIFDTLMKGQ